MADPQTSPPGPQDLETPTFGVLNTSPGSPLEQYLGSENGKAVGVEHSPRKSAVRYLKILKKF